MTTANHPAPARRGRLLTPREWPLWREPRAAAVYVVAVTAFALGLGAWSAVRGSPQLWQLPIFVVLLACAGICVEGTRRFGDVEGLAKDLLFAWGLPVALLLSPVYAFLFPIPLALLEQLRVKRGLCYRVVFSTAAKAIGGVLASVAFRLRLPGPPGSSDSLLASPEVLIPLAAGCGAACIVVNGLLVGLAIRLSKPHVPLREVFWDREAVTIDLAELCTGLLVTVVAGLALPLVALAVPPVLLLQRSLVHAQLRAAARTDAKTGLLNATTWQLEAETEVARAKRTGASLALLLVDIDHFKRVNDVHGHLLGDDVLVAVAGMLGDHLRDYDLLGRFGGEEFVVLLPETESLEAHRVAERLRAYTRMLAVPAERGQVGVTVSLGVALLRRHGDDLTELLAAADLALYRAKAAGRDRVYQLGGEGASGARSRTERPGRTPTTAPGTSEGGPGRSDRGGRSGREKAADGSLSGKRTLP